jgi:hypothetical protein
VMSNHVNGAWKARAGSAGPKPAPSLSFSCCFAQYS